MSSEDQRIIDEVSAWEKAERRLRADRRRVAINVLVALAIAGAVLGFVAFVIYTGRAAEQEHRDRDRAFAECVAAIGYEACAPMR